MKTNNFYACDSADSVQLRYDELCKIFSDHEPILQALKEEYSTLMAVLTESKPVEEVKEKVSLSDIINVFQERVNPEGLKLEIVGRWLWLSGATFAIREALKQLDFRYSSDKKSWYWRSDKNRSSNEKPIPLEMIREKFGSQQVALK